jgi:hypothetical protein
MARGLASFVASRLDLERRQLAFPRNMFAYAVKLALRLFSEEAENTNGVNSGRSLRESLLRMGLS